MLGHVLGLRARLQPCFPWMPEDLQMKAEDLLTIDISCRNSADLDFSGLVGSFQSGCLKKGPALILPLFVALMSCPMSRCCAV